MATPTSLDVQSVVDKYAKALEVPRLIFDLYPSPRTQGAPEKKYKPLPTAVVLSIVGGFEGFAEDLLALAMLRQGHGWAHVAQNANLTNPSVRDLLDQLLHTTGIDGAPANGWTTSLPKQTSATGWTYRDENWDGVVRRGDGWIQVRHALAHGLVTGLGKEVWPGPVSRKHHSRYGTIPSANDDDVLAYVKETPTTNQRGLYLWPSIACARLFSAAAAQIAEAVATHFGETVDTTALDRFSGI